MLDKRTIFETDDGSHSVWSENFAVSYHSRFGAVEESQHVFINAGLRLKAAVQSDIKILEIGMGTGLNALMTFLEGQRRALSIDYTTVEAHPLSPDQAAKLNYPKALNAVEQEAIFRKIHECAWGRKQKISDSFRLKKYQKKLEDVNFVTKFDLIFYDAFAPDFQPEMWSESVLQQMYEVLLPDGVLVTYCAKGDVKRMLKKVGFTVESIPGPPRKREMTRAWRMT